MLNLQAGINLQKIECIAIRVVNKLYRSGAAVIHPLAQRHRGGQQRTARRGRQIRRRCLFHHFLVAALQRAVTFTQRHNTAFTVAKNLHFDMTGFVDTTLDKYPGITEELLPETANAVPGLTQCVFVRTAGQADPAASGGAFQHHRIANFLRRMQGFIKTIQQASPRRHWHTCGGGQFAGTVFKAKFTNLLRGRPDKHNPGLLTGIGKRQTFGEKPVARPDSLSAALLCGRDNFVDTQIAVAGLVTAERQSNIRGFHMFRIFVGVGKYRHAGDPQTLQGTNGPAGDFAPVGNKDGIKHGRSPGWQSSCASP